MVTVIPTITGMHTTMGIATRRQLTNTANKQTNQKITDIHMAGMDTHTGMVTPMITDMHTEDTITRTRTADMATRTGVDITKTTRKSTRNGRMPDRNLQNQNSPTGSCG